MKDYSEVMAGMQSRIVKLNDLLAQQRWIRARMIATQIDADLLALMIWIDNKEKT